MPKQPPPFQINDITGRMVGGAYPNHDIAYVETDYNAIKIIENYNDPKIDFKNLY